MELKAPSGRGAVDTLAEAHERDAERLKFLDECDQVSQVATKSVEPPGDHDIEPVSYTHLTLPTILLV